MRELVSTLIIEPRSLVREALISLMARNSYQVVGGVASTADIDNSLLVANAPKLVILGALPAQEAIAAGSCIRKLLPETKFVLLFDCASPADFQKLLASDIDGCIPFSASPDVLISAFAQIFDGDCKILIQDAASRSAIASPSAPSPAAEGVIRQEVRSDAFDGTFSVRVRHGLSEREEQILKSLVKGQGNKIIARTLDIAEATVKVHMKSVLRKIRLANRTQAAIWAVENGYGAATVLPELPRLEAAA
jgi:two-component system nitrate/nitrite response regulator NarL